jgi:hypothetical protein
MAGIDFNYSRTDERGVAHHYPKLFGWRCSIHNRVCSPFAPITADDLLTRAANDPRLDDDTFAVIARAVDGRPVLDEPAP